ncbi:MAG: formimidoylglutamate deiminase [Anaeromyxobacter sp.]
MTTARAFLPDLLLAGGALHAGAALTVKDGRVLAVGEPAPGAKPVPLPGQLLIPGLVSAHGHAFQRAIRGRTERRAPGSGGVPETFWTWRRAMYDAAARLGADALETVARFAYAELARAGVTAVGEFHYLHHAAEGQPFADSGALALRLVRAARSVGLRVVLLDSAYARPGAPGAALEPAQLRFFHASLEDYLEELAALREGLRGDPLAGVGIAPHSVRACPLPWLTRLAEVAWREGLPLHVHAAEQPAEVAACRAEHGVTPVELLHRAGALGPGTTLVHAIHLDDADIRRVGEARATICACPLTERNLGDGVVPADRLREAGVRLALGVDSHAEADPLGEARALELQLRLVRGQRAVLDGPPGTLGARLLEAATAGGMASLGLAGGRLAPGEPADFAVLDLADPSIAGASRDALLDTVVFAASPRAVRSSWVAGEPVLVEGRLASTGPEERDLTAGFAEVMRALWGA